MGHWSICLTPFWDASWWYVHAAAEPVDGGCRICYLARSREEAEAAAREIREHFLVHRYSTKADAMKAAAGLLRPALAYPLQVEEDQTSA